MPSVPAVTAYCGLVLVGVALLPTGLLLVRLGERWVGGHLRLSVPERLLVALYATGGLLFLVASIPAPLFGLPAVLAILAVGGALWLALTVRDRGSGLRGLFAFARTLPGALLGALTLGLLAAEVLGVAPLALGNGLDGSVYSLYLTLLLHHHAIPWTLEPYAAIGVAYPQAATVWLAVPAVLLNWPVVALPLLVPAFFLALTPAAAFCLGERLAADRPAAFRPYVGILFAAFFGVTASWPRLFVGGSFDFVLAFPLFLVCLGWVVPFLSAGLRSWRETVAFGLVVGVVSGLSVVIGVTLLLLLGGFLLASSGATRRNAGRWALRWLAVAGLGALFLARSLYAVSVWFDYPGHVLTPVGSPPTALPYVTPTLTLAYLNDELNPFVLFKPKLSPIPWLSVELAALLAAGAVCAAIVSIRPRTIGPEYLSPALVRTVLVGVGVLLVETVGFIVLASPNLFPRGLPSVVNVEEPSILLFTFFELLALLPLVAALTFLASRPRRVGRTGGRTPPEPPPDGRRVPISRSRDRARWWAVTAAVLLVVPLGSGALATGAEVPAYIDSHIHALANVSSGDIAALEWSGRYLPTCSQVLVAPGSVGQYLPEYATVGVVFPAFPTPVNLSYQSVVHAFDVGVGVNNTTADLVELGITEVFVSGQTSVSYRPFLLGPLQASPEFRTLFEAGDAAVLEFVQGATGANCLP